MMLVVQNLQGNDKLSGAGFLPIQVEIYTVIIDWNNQSGFIFS